MPVVFDTSAFEKSFAQLRSDLHEQLKGEWARTAAEARASMINDGYRDKTGELSRGMYSTIYESGYCDFQADVVAGARIALWIDQPTKGHWIPKNERRRTWYAGYQEEEGGRMTYLRNKKGTGVKARRHKMLRWFVGGKPVFAKRVWHPPWPGAHFTEHMAAKYTELFPEHMQRELDSTVTRHDG